MKKEDFSVNDLIKIKSGKIYRIVDLRTDYKDSEPMIAGYLQRNGKDFGPYRCLLIRNIVSAIMI